MPSASILRPLILGPSFWVRARSRWPRHTSFSLGSPSHASRYVALGPLPKLASRTAGRVTGLLCNGSLRLRRSTAVCSTDRDNDVTGVGRPSRPSAGPGPRTVIFDGRLWVTPMAVSARLAAARRLRECDSGRRAAVAPGDRPGQYPQGGPQRPFRYHGEDPGCLPGRVDGRPVVVRGHERAAGDGLEHIAVDVADLRADLAEDRPRDLMVGHQGHDGDGYVIAAHRVVVQRLAIHMNDEAVPDGAHGLAGGVHQHPGAIDRHVSLRVAQYPEDRRWVRRDRPLDLQPLARHLLILPVGLSWFRRRRPGMSPAATVCAEAGPLTKRRCGWRRRPVMGFEHILVERSGEFATVTMNRPDRRNALSLRHMRELITAFRDIGDSDALGIVLAGNGPVFSAGHDFADVADADLSAVRSLLVTCTELMTLMQQVPQPVVARVHGLATAAGCQLVATADLAVASENAGFAAPGGKGGWFCHTPMVAIARNVGRKRAAELALSGDVIDARTALDWGLVNRVVPAAQLDSAVRDLLDRVTRGSADSKGIGKQALYAQIDLDQPKAYAYAIEVMAATSQLPDAREGMRAFLEKRKPNWDRGRP